MPYEFQYGGKLYVGQYPTMNVAVASSSFFVNSTSTTTNDLTFQTLTINATGYWHNNSGWYTPVGGTSVPLPIGGGNTAWYREQNALQGITPAHPQEVKKKELAKKKALTLLRQNLSRKQWSQYKDLGYFEVISQKGNVYRIYEGRSRNIKRLVEGKRVVETLCAHPALQVPNGDTLLSQKLMLECAEDDFRKIANIDSVSGPHADVEWGVAA